MEANKNQTLTMLPNSWYELLQGSDITEENCLAVAWTY